MNTQNKNFTLDSKFQSFFEDRKAMIESQLRPNNIEDNRILQGFMAIPRELFVPETCLTPYVDGIIALENQKFMLPPLTVAKMISFAKLKSFYSVLDINSISGYSSAIISTMVKKVISMDLDDKMHDERIISSLNIRNLEFVTGELRLGYPSLGNYDRIFIQGEVDVLEDSLLSQLTDQGSCFSIQNIEGSTKIVQTFKNKSQIIHGKVDSKSIKNFSYHENPFKF